MGGEWLRRGGLVFFFYYKERGVWGLGITVSGTRLDGGDGGMGGFGYDESSILMSVEGSIRACMQGVLQIGSIYVTSYVTSLDQ